MERMVATLTLLASFNKAIAHDPERYEEKVVRKRSQGK
jgi:hypothetical protein